MPRIKSIAELNRELVARQKQLAKLESKRTKLAANLQTVEKQIGVLTGRAVPAPARAA